MRYYGKAAHMSADMKRAQHALRTRYPRRYTKHVETKMPDRKVERVEVVDAAAMTPRERHEFSRMRPKPYWH